MSAINMVMYVIHLLSVVGILVLLLLQWIESLNESNWQTFWDESRLEMIVRLILTHGYATSRAVHYQQVPQIRIL